MFNRHEQRQLLSGAILLAICCILISACGKKAPPSPPRQAEPPVVKDLSRHIQGNQLLLTWTLSEQRGLQQAGLSGFSVYKSSQKNFETECRNCPVLFERVAVIPVYQAEAPLPAGKVFEFSDTLEKGVRYHYKVMTNWVGGSTGKDSNTIVFQH